MPPVASLRSNRALALVAKTCLHTLVFPGAVLVGLPWLVLEQLPEAGRFSPFWLPGWLLALPLLLGIAGGVKLSWDFISLGDGTPNPLDPPKRLVVTSLYRFVRNPGYLALVPILVSEALYFGSASLLLYTLVVMGWAHVFVVRVEEPGLRTRFGDEYDRFCAAVPRWIPRLTPWRRELGS